MPGETRTLVDADEEIARLREERAPEIAEALLQLIRENKEPEPQGMSFFASAIYEIAFAYGEEKHGRRNVEAIADKASGPLKILIEAILSGKPMFWNGACLVELDAIAVPRGDEQATMVIDDEDLEAISKIVDLKKE